MGTLPGAPHLEVPSSEFSKYFSCLGMADPHLSLLGHFVILYTLPPGIDQCIPRSCAAALCMCVCMSVCVCVCVCVCVSACPTSARPFIFHCSGKAPKSSKMVGGLLCSVCPPGCQQAVLGVATPISSEGRETLAPIPLSFLVSDPGNYVRLTLWEKAWTFLVQMGRLFWLHPGPSPGLPLVAVWRAWVWQH